MYKDLIKLISYTFGKNNIGDSVKTPVPREVFANEKSIRQSEFYQAAVQGLRPSIMFEVSLHDYDKEQMLEYDGITYKIIRTYKKNTEVIELVCQGIVNEVI